VQGDVPAYVFSPVLDELIAWVDPRADRLTHNKSRAAGHSALQLIASLYMGDSAKTRFEATRNKNPRRATV
jgi:hypothetical protein